VAASTTEGGTAPVQGRLWSARARDWAEVQEATTVLPLFEAIADSLGVGAGTRVLDVGCGAGRFLRLAADRGADVAGLDPTAALVAIARERLPGGPSRGRDGAAAVGRRQLRCRLGHQRLPVRGPARRGRRRSGPRRPARRPGRGRHLGPARRLRGRGVPRRPRHAAATAATGRTGPVRALPARCARVARARAAGLQPEAETSVETVWEYPDEETLLRGLLSAGPAARAIAEAGEARVRDAVLAAVAPYRTPGGAYRLHNAFRYAIAAHR
jgi:SAM-dependent methyltransferase